MVIKGFRHLFFLVFMLSSVAIIAEPVVVKPQSAIHSTNKASWADYLSIHKLFNRCKNYFGYGLAKESAS